jgi:hypothetical protein
MVADLLVYIKPNGFILFDSLAFPSYGIDYINLIALIGNFQEAIRAFDIHQAHMGNKWI